MIQVPEDIKQFTEPNTLLYHKFFSTDAVADELEVNVFNQLSLLSLSAHWWQNSISMQENTSFYAKSNGGGLRELENAMWR